MKKFYKRTINNNTNYEYSNHILNTEYAYGGITDTTNIKKNTFNTLEKYHIYKIIKNTQHMNDIHFDIYNPIFETVQTLNTR